MKLNLLLCVACAGLVACDNGSPPAPDEAAKPPSGKPAATTRPKPAPRSPQARREPVPVVLTGEMTGPVAFPPAGRHKVDLLTTGSTPAPEAEALGKKFHEALAADPAWLQSYLKELDLAPGELLPYHEKMGVTKEEYATLMEAVRNMALTKVSDAAVRFSQAKGQVVLHIEGVALPAEAFVFSADGQTMNCALGRSAARTTIDQKDESSPTGAWKGSQWVITKGKPEQALTSTEDAWQATVAIGKDTSERHLIYLRIIGRRQQSPLNITYILRWPQ
jgi:hypothetical protein